MRVLIGRKEVRRIRREKDVFYRGKEKKRKERSVRQIRTASARKKNSPRRREKTGGVFGKGGDGTT